MRARVRSIFSTEVELDDFRATVVDDFALQVRLIVGPLDSPGDESFDVTVCTPVWIARWISEFGPLDGRHHLVVLEWNAKQIRTLLTNEFESQEADDWATLGEKLSRFGRWEFEDYRANNQI
jgi:hypothetical protein